MTLYLYITLSDEELEEISATQGAVRPKQCVMLGLTPIQFDADGRPYYVVRNENAPKQVLVPPSLRGRVESVSWRVHHLRQNNVPGTYAHETATAIVEDIPNGSAIAQITGPNMDHVYELACKLREGTVPLQDQELPPEAQEVMQMLEETNSRIMERPARKLSERMTLDEFERLTRELLDELRTASEPSGRILELMSVLVPTANDAKPSQELDAETLRFACKKCGQAYSFATGKIKTKFLKVRCKKCGTKIVVKEKQPKLMN